MPRSLASLLRAFALSGLATTAACAGHTAAHSTTPDTGQGKNPDDMVLGQPCAEGMLAMPATDESHFGPLEVGADYAGYHKVSTAPFPSKTHGGRWVEVYVNDAGLAAYTTDAPFPVGSVIVKASWEDDGGKPGPTPGPVFVMRKEAPGYAKDHDDWYYAIHWAKPTPKQEKLLGGPIYWRGHSMKVSYCVKCHDNYDREIGGVPKGSRSWEK